MPILLYMPRNKSSYSIDKDSDPILVFDHAEDRAESDLNFRVSSRAYHISASGQPNKSEYRDLLLNRLPTKNKKVWLLNLRDETTLYINDKPVSVYLGSNVAHVGLERESIAREENLLARLLSFRRYLDVRRLIKGADGHKSPQQPRRIKLETILTEQQLVDELAFQNKINVNFRRFCVSDHDTPDPLEVDLFVDFVRDEHSEEDVVHFHCRAGKARSAQFLTMLKALYAAKYPHVSTEGDIPDVLSMDKLTRNGSVNDLKEAVVQRCDFIENFQDYAKSGFMQNISWRDWLKARAVAGTSNKRLTV